jgi:hypothetical protein
VEELYSEVTLFLFFNHTEGVFWDIALFVPMMESVITSETSVNLYETARYRIPEDSYLHARRRENLKSH